MIRLFDTSDDTPSDGAVHTPSSHSSTKTIHRHQKPCSQPTRSQLRAFVTSLLWNAAVSCFLCLALVNWLALAHSTNLITHAVNALALCVVLVELVLRAVVGGLGLNFLVSHKDSTSLIIAAVASWNYVASLTHHNNPQTLAGAQAALFVIRIFWIFPIAVVTARRAQINTRPRTNTELAFESRAQQCIRILMAVKRRLEFSLDSGPGSTTTDVDFVIDSITSDKLYATPLQEAVTRTTLTQSSFSRQNSFPRQTQNSKSKQHNEQEKNHRTHRFPHRINNHHHHQQKPHHQHHLSSGIDVAQTWFLRMFFSDQSARKTVPSIRRISATDISNSDDDEQVMFPDLAEWHFDIFKAASQSNQRPLHAVGRAVFIALNLPETFSIPLPILSAWLTQLESGYRPNPYHNSTHAADVLQCAYFMLVKTGLLEVLSDVEVLAVVVASAIHDFAHVGLTNNFLKTTQNELAITYNDVSILENFHASEGWKTCVSPEHNIFANIPVGNFQYLRELVLDMVLNTDMTKHGSNAAVFSSKLAQGLDLTLVDDRKLLLRNLVHLCDLSNAARQLKVSAKWSRLVMEEFFTQGDEEKRLGLPVSPNMDRAGGDAVIAKCQLAFLQFIVRPIFKDWCQFLRHHRSRNSAGLVALLLETHIELNIEHWTAEHHALSPTESSRIKRPPHRNSRILVWEPESTIQRPSVGPDRGSDVEVGTGSEKESVDVPRAYRSRSVETLKPSLKRPLPSSSSTSSVRGGAAVV